MVIAGFLYYLRLLYLHIAMLTSSLPLRYQSSLSLSLGRTNVCMTPRQAFPIALSLFIVQLQSKATTRILIKADLTMFCLPSGSLLWPFQLYTTPSPPRPAIRNCTRSYLDVLERLLEGSIQKRICILMYSNQITQDHTFLSVLYGTRPIWWCLVPRVAVGIIKESFGKAISFDPLFYIAWHIQQLVYRLFLRYINTRTFSYKLKMVHHFSILYYVVSDVIITIHIILFLWPTY